jgi:hypothetical protein
MVFLAELWLPILVSAVFVFIASNILWMGLPFWHSRDYLKLPDEAPFMAGSKAAGPGMYMYPKMDWKTMTPEDRENLHNGPSGLIYLKNPATFSFSRTLGAYFLYTVLGSVCAAYIAGATLPRGVEYMRVFQVAGATGMIFWAFGTNGSDSIWYGKPWAVAIKHVVDGLIFGLLIGGTFGWLWPS